MKVPSCGPVLPLGESSYGILIRTTRCSPRDPSIAIW
jgi:hypothetical protein